MDNETYYYSVKGRGFYSNMFPEVLKKAIEEYGDLTEIATAEYNSFFSPPDGYYGVFDESGPHIEKIPEPDHAAENLQKSQIEYDRASDQITALQQRIEDEDYDATNTESAVAASKTTWTTYRKALRAYIAAADGTKALPAAPDA